MTSIRPRPRSIHGALALTCLLVYLGGLTACTTASGPPVSPPMQAYRVGPPDILHITILPDPLIEREVVVRPDGMISVDLIGDISAAGRTPQEIATDIQTRISRFKRDAQVTVALGAALSSEITVLGEVARPGTFPLARQTRFVEAIGAVGGPTLFAARSRVRVIRFEEGATKVYIANLKAIESGDMGTNFLLQGGDLIVVPPSNWAAFGYAMQAALFPVQQLFGFGTRVTQSVLLPGT